MERNLKKLILLLLIPLLLFSLTACKMSSHNEEAVRVKIKDYLYQKYGEEFVVDRIGTRSDRSGSFYQARIYPKSIIGTNREGDSYYYASASVNKLTLGRLDDPGDSYSYVARNMDVEKYLLPYTKQTFGERVVLKVDVAHKVTGDGSWWAGYKSVSLAEMRKDIAEDPERNRIELELYVYIFDRIDSEREKEERRKQIFDYVRYLKEEGLFKYLELGVIFIDERVLAPSYWEYARDIYPANLVEEEVEGEIVYLPPRDLREEMSEVLQKEIDGMSEEELLARMGKIRKSGLGELIEYNADYGAFIYSISLLQAEYPSSITEEDRERDYSELSHVRLVNSIKYIYE